MSALTESRYPPEVLAELEALKAECAICYQCGTCTSSCPSGRELYRGPRRLVRLVLAGEVDALLKSDDLWRCTECGTCTSVCRMGIDVAGVLATLRRLERAYGAIRCAERAAADIATSQLQRRPRIDNLRLGAAMASHGYVPKDKLAAAQAGAKLARQMLPIGKRRATRAAARPMPAPDTASSETIAPDAASGDAGARGALTPDPVTLPFYAGCSLPQDHELNDLVHEVAAGFGVRLEEAPDAGCCGHPSRGAIASLFHPERRVYTACPACDASLAESGIEAAPLWHALTELAGRSPSISLRAAGARFVPYVGCLTDRDAALAALGAAADQAGADLVVSYPTLHNGCCGALGGMYRGATKSSARLLEYAAEQAAPIVTPCVLCRDNLRSAARELRHNVTVYFWPEFFRAAPMPAPSTRAAQPTSASTGLRGAPQ